MLLMLDNYDSFLNLVQYLGTGAGRARVFPTTITVEEVGETTILSMVRLAVHPTRPDFRALDLSRRRFPFLGVCLGHQSIGQAFGGKIIHAKQLMHGNLPVFHHDIGVFKGCPIRLHDRYHSLVIEQKPSRIAPVTAWTEDGEMWAWHKTFDRGLHSTRVCPDRIW